MKHSLWRKFYPIQQKGIFHLTLKTLKTFLCDKYLQPKNSNWAKDISIFSVLLPIISLRKIYTPDSVTFILGQIQFSGMSWGCRASSVMCWTVLPENVHIILAAPWWDNTVTNKWLAHIVRGKCVITLKRTSRQPMTIIWYEWWTLGYTDQCWCSTVSANGLILFYHIYM